MEKTVRHRAATVGLVLRADARARERPGRRESGLGRPRCLGSNALRCVLPAGRGQPAAALAVGCSCGRVDPSVRDRVAPRRPQRWIPPRPGGCRCRRGRRRGGPGIDGGCSQRWVSTWHRAAAPHRSTTGRISSAPEAFSTRSQGPAGHRRWMKRLTLRLGNAIFRARWKIMGRPCIPSDV
jgi:hypothetical protein